MSELSVSEILERAMQLNASVTVTLPDGTVVSVNKRSSSAERQARYRERKAAGLVQAKSEKYMSPVTKRNGDVTNVTDSNGPDTNAMRQSGADDGEFRLFSDDELPVIPEKPKRSTKLAVSPKVQAAIADLMNRRVGSIPTWSPSDVASSKHLIGIPDDDLLEDIQIMKQAKLSGWEYFSRKPQQLFNNWETQVQMAEEHLARIEEMRKVTKVQFSRA